MPNKKYRVYSDFTAQGKNFQVFSAFLYRFENKQISNHELPALVVFAAFTIESYLNSLGSRNIPYWEDLERLPWRNKVRIIFKDASAELNWGEDPLQFATEVFGLRDKLAHGKPERVISQYFDTYDEACAHLRDPYGLNLRPPWLVKIESDWTSDFRVRFENLMSYLAQVGCRNSFDYCVSANGGILHD